MNQGSPKECELVAELHLAITGTVLGFITRKIDEGDPEVAKCDPGRIALGATMNALADACLGALRTGNKLSRADLFAFIDTRLAQEIQ